jgi:hypothetical protein
MRRLLLATLGATLALAVPAAARDLYLRPASTSMQQPGWFASPYGTPFATVLDDPVVQPAAPDTGADYLGGVGSGEHYASVGMAPPALNAGENVTGATAWVYAATGAAQSLTISLWAGNQVLAWRYFGPGQAAGWRSVPVSQAPTADQAGKLSLLLRSNSSSSYLPWGRTYASYVDLATDGNDTAPPSVDSGPAPPLPPATPSGVTIALSRVHVIVERGRAVAPLTLGCPAGAVGRCRGTVTITLLADPPKTTARKLARAARCGRGCRPIGKGKFDIAAGKRRKVKVRMALRRDALFAKHGRRRRAKVTATMTDGAGRRTVTSRVVTLTD